MKVKDGYYPFGLCVNKEIIGFASLTDLGNGIFEMNNLAVLPEWRHYGFGRQLLSFCKSSALEQGQYPQERRRVAAHPRPPTTETAQG